MKKLYFPILLAITLLASSAFAHIIENDINVEKEEAPEKLLTTQQWIEDLDFMVDRLKEIHPNIYSKITEEDFSILVRNAKLRIEQSESDIGCYMEIRKVISSIQDGHTYLSYKGVTNFVSEKLPIKFDCFSDGIYLSAVDSSNKSFLGMEVTAIGGIPIDVALQRVMEITTRDNYPGRKKSAINVFRYPIILNGLNLSDNKNSITLTLRDEKNQLHDFHISTIKDWKNNQFFTVETLLTDSIPLHLKNRDRQYWFEYLKDESALYFQFNAIGDQGGDEEPLDHFLSRFWQYLDKHSNEISKLIIDIRNNSGGTGRMAIPIVKEIMKRDYINNNESLFVITGNRTYSAAVVMSTALLEFTEAVFVGDAPGCPSNLFSNSIAAGKLPNSKHSLSIATRQIDNAWVDNREYFPIDIPALFSSSNYLKGEDPVLETIFSGNAEPIWKIAKQNGVEMALAKFNEITSKYPDLKWWNSSILESRINDHGIMCGRNYYFEKDEARKNQFYKESEHLLLLNTKLCPESSAAFESLGFLYMISGKNELAILNYEKSLELNPTNPEIKAMLDGIR
jgi:tetratricopeptide (TPR) repeat protein